MTLHLNAQVEKIHYGPSRFNVILEGKNIEAEHLLVSVGRKPHLSELQLDNGGIAFTERGILIDAFRQNLPKAYLCRLGTRGGPPFFTHLAEKIGLRTVLTTLLLSPD